MDAAAVRRYVRRLIDDVVAQAPTMRARITIDDMRDAATDDLQEHSRERLYLHTAPLPVEVVNEADLPQGKNAVTDASVTAPSGPNGADLEDAGWETPLRGGCRDARPGVRLSSRASRAAGAAWRFANQKQ